MKIYDFYCADCGRTEERCVRSLEEAESLLCNFCGDSVLKRLPSSPKLSYRLMGLDPNLGTAGDKWAKMHEDGAKAEWSPNLVHI